MGALGLLIGPGIAAGGTVLGATFTFGGNLGGAKLILVAKVIGGLVVDVLETSPLVNFVVPFVVALLLSGFFAGAEIGRIAGFGEPLVSGCLLREVDVRGVVFVFGVVANFVADGVLGDVGVLGDAVGVVLVKETRVVVGVILADVGREAGIEVLAAGLVVAFVGVVVAFTVVVFGAVVGRTLAVGFVVDGAVVGLTNGFDVVDDAVVFLRIGADDFEANGLERAVFVVVVLVLETVVSIFLDADFLEARPTPVTAATAAAPTAAATAISATCN